MRIPIIAALVLFLLLPVQAQDLSQKTNPAAPCGDQSPGIPDSYYQAVVEHFNPPGFKNSVIRIAVGNEVKIIVLMTWEKFELWTDIPDTPQKSVYAFLQDLDQECRLPPDPADAAALIKVKWESRELSAAQFEQIHSGFVRAMSHYISKVQKRYGSLAAKRTRSIYLDMAHYHVMYDNNNEHVEAQVWNVSKPDPMLDWINGLHKLAEDSFHRSFAPKPMVVPAASTPVFSVAYSPDGKTLATGGWPNTVKLWEVTTGRDVGTLTGAFGFVSGIAYSADGKRLAAVGEDSTVELWDTATGRAILTLADRTGSTHSIAYSPDGRTIATSFRKRIKLWNAATGRETRTFAGHADVVASVAFSPDGRTLASDDDDNTIRLWDVATGRETRALTGSSDSARVAFSPDGKTLASVSLDKTISLWDLATGQVVRTLTGHTDFVEAVAFSPDGRTLASGSQDRTIKLWDTITGREVRTIVSDTDSVFSVAFSPDGKTLASGSFDHTVKLWDVATGRVIWTVIAPPE